jgi:hypothetical protein
LPLDGTLVSRSARRRAAKAVELGLTCEITDDAEAVSACLSDSERRQGFLLRYLVGSPSSGRYGRYGPSALRMYLCRDADGNAAASRVILHAPLGTAVDWLAGTADPQLSTGATQRLIQFALEDLGRVGATAFDFAGANLSTVAKAKSHWAANWFLPTRYRNLDHGASLGRAGRGGVSCVTRMFLEAVEMAQSDAGAENDRYGDAKGDIRECGPNSFARRLP